MKMWHDIEGTKLR